MCNPVGRIKSRCGGPGKDCSAVNGEFASLDPPCGAAPGMSRRRSRWVLALLALAVAAVRADMTGMHHFNPGRTGPALPAQPPAAIVNRYAVDDVRRQAERDTVRVRETAPEEAQRLPYRFTGPTIAVRERSLTFTVRAFGRVELNEDSLFDAIVTQSGLVRRLFVFPGQSVQAGQPLISIFSPERINAQHMFLADYSKDEGNRTRLEYYSSFGSTASYLEQSKSNLKWWGFSDRDITRLLKTGKIQQDYVVTAARQGYVIDTLKDAGAVVVAGGRGEENFVLPGDTLLHEARLASVWGMTFVRPQDYAYFKLGALVKVAIGEGQNVTRAVGVVVHKHELANPATRHADFHVLLGNVDGGVPPGSFIAVRLPITETGVWIPAAAVLHAGTRNFVVVQRAHGSYLQRVRIDRYAGGEALVGAGLEAGAHIVRAPRAEVDPDRQSEGLRAWN